MGYAPKGAGAAAFDEFRMIYDARAAALDAVRARLRPRIDAVRVGEAGGLTVSRQHAFRLVAFPDGSGRIEAWRVLVRGGAHRGFPSDTV